MTCANSKIAPPPKKKSLAVPLLLPKQELRLIAFSIYHLIYELFTNKSINNLYFSYS